MDILSRIAQYKFEIALIVLCALAIFARSVFLANDLGERDIYYQHVEALKIRDGINPYERILGEDLRINKKYPTFLPFSYLVILGLSSLVGYDFVAFTVVLRALTLLADCLTALVLLRIGQKKRLPFLGLAAAAFWLFSRWSIYNFAQARLDGIAISLAVLAVYLYRRSSRFWPFFVMSFSLGVKQLGVFILPLFFFDSLRGRNWADLLRRAALLFSIPLVFSLPFFLKNPEGLLYSLGFSFTRLPEISNVDFGWDLITRELGNYLLPKSGLVGTFRGMMLYYVFPRFPLFILFFLLMTFAYLEKWGKYLTALVGMLLFLSLNPVIFSQYFVWVMPFVLVAGLASVPNDSSIEAQRKKRKTTA